MNHLLAHFLLFLVFILPISGQAWNISQKGVQAQLDNPQRWAEKGIERDFSVFEEGFSQADISHCISRLKQMQGIHAAGLALISIAEGQITHEPLFDLSSEQNNCLHGFLSALNALSEIYPLPSISFLMTFEPSFDRPLLLREAKVPIFAISKERGNHKVVLIPRLWNYRREKSAELNYPWEEKIERALFRGATSDGPPYGYYDWDFRPRARLALRSRLNRSLLDAALTPSTSLSAYINNWMNGMGLLTTRMLPLEQIKYKYLIAMDGRSAPSSLEWQLFSGSLPLKASSNKIEWFYAGLDSDFHYIEIRPDSEDLIEKIRWLKSHDVEAKEIAGNARAFALENLLDESLFAYLYRVLETYSVLYSP